MPKPDHPLPDDISARLEIVITQCVADLRQKIQHMFRFANMDEVMAARQVLTEKASPMPLAAIVEELKGGGIWRPATGAFGSSADSEMRRSIGRAAAHGVNLKYVDRDKDLIGLPEWK